MVADHNTKIAREAVILTSRLLDKFRKRKQGHDDSSEEEHLGSNAQSPAHFPGEICRVLSRAQDYDQGMDMCNDSDDEEDSSNIPSLVFDDSDLDPELDEELLTRKELTAYELLEGEFMAEEMGIA
ncbi:hypothetical protein B0H14DRAFT_3509234 [Mycena olivaceomarginata]|nr:hypothetical protein B0H14DRAFT_3509234 [Mycena olivaceomarginata]